MDPLFVSTSPVQGQDEAGGSIGHEARDTLDDMPVHCRTQTMDYNMDNLEMPV